MFLDCKIQIANFCMLLNGFLSGSDLTLPIVKEKIKFINELELESVCNDIVKSNNLTRKEWNNVKTILIGMFSFAIRKQYTTFNPMEKITIYVKYKQIVNCTCHKNIQ